MKMTSLLRLVFFPNTDNFLTCIDPISDHDMQPVIDEHSDISPFDSAVDRDAQRCVVNRNRFGRIISPP